MRTKILGLALSIFFLLTLSECLAQGPEVPHAFYGSVRFIDGPALSGMVVTAKVNGVERGSAVISNGNYGPYLLVRDPGNEVNEGDTIYFYVNGIQANEVATFHNGEITKLDLTVNALLPTTTTIPPVTGGGGGAIVTTTTTTIPTTTTTVPEVIPVSVASKFEIIELSIPEEVTANEPFEISVKVKNTGDVKGSDEITLALPKGWKPDSWRKMLTLDAGESAILRFTIIPNENKGRIGVGSSVDFEMSKEIVPRVEEVRPEPLPLTGMLVKALESVDWFIVFGFVIIVLGVFFAWKKPFKKFKKTGYRYKPKKR
jgi:hypothetical protein